MKFVSTPLKGAFLIEMEPRADERGFFARAFCAREFSTAGLTDTFVQMNNSVSFGEGTLRGMHYQLEPAAEIKLVRCIHGALFDVIVDVRSDSPTYRKWFGAELSDENRRMMYVPRGFAHGFQTLRPNTEVLYMVSEFYAPDLERGIRWDDPLVNIAWPREPTEISLKDRGWPALQNGQT